MERLLELALQRSEQAEVFETDSDGTRVHYEANQVKQVESREVASVALRIIRDGRIGFAAASGKYDPAELVEMAVETSTFGAKARLDFPAAAPLKPVRTYDDTLIGLSLDDLIETGVSAIRRVTARYPDVQCEGLVSRSESRIRVINSAGLDVSVRRTGLGLMMEGVRVNGTDMLFVGDHASSTFYFDAADRVATTMLLQLERASRSATIATGIYPVLFTPHGVDIALLLPLAVAFNGKNVVEKASRLAGRQGEQVFDSSLTMYDDPTLEGRPTSSPFDDEGVPSRRVDLIDRGVVAEFLFDLQTAGEANVAGTGSGRRMDGRSQVRPGMSAFVIESGDSTFEQMLSQIDEGIVVDELIGAGQGNLLAGDFGGNVLLGYKVEKGRIVGRVKDTMIAGNILDVLSRGVVAGNDPRWVGANLWTPSLLCEGVSVSAGGGAA
jgi:PmbA protein